MKKVGTPIRIDGSLPIVRRDQVAAALEQFMQARAHYIQTKSKVEVDPWPDELPDDASPELRDYWHAAHFYAAAEEFLMYALDAAALEIALSYLRDAAIVPQGIRKYPL